MDISTTAAISLGFVLGVTLCALLFIEASLFAYYSQLVDRLKEFAEEEAKADEHAAGNEKIEKIETGETKDNE